MWLAERLADPLTPVAPVTLPGKLGPAVTTIIGWSITGALFACILGGVLGLAAVGIGNTSERPELAARGKKGVMWSLIAAAGIGLIYGLVQAFYNLGK